MTEPNDIEGLTAAVQRYLDLMYDADVARFDAVFQPTAQLHGFRDGQMTMIPAATFKQLLAGRPSAQAVGAPREETILALDFASDNQAMAKVRVRIDTIVYVDYLSYHRIGGDWRVTAKSFHVERRLA